MCVKQKRLKKSQSKFTSNRISCIPPLESQRVIVMTRLPMVKIVFSIDSVSF